MDVNGNALCHQCTSFEHWILPVRFGSPEADCWKLLHNWELLP